MEYDDWNRRATNILKAELALSGIGYDELIKRLAAFGINESYKGVANKINRGAFSFLFFMQCMKALGKTTIRLEHD